jgi:hypothetical protein
MPALPGASLRLGVTGARALDPAQLARLTEQLADQLRAIAAHARRYGVEPSHLRLLSPLAEGADRLVAEAALAEGFSLTCPLPFQAAEYEKDFATEESRDQFRRLLARADGRVLALDGARGDYEERSYEAVGRLVVRNCDLLIAIWDGGPSKGRGGTSDIVHYSAGFGPPIIWLHAADATAAPHWLEGVQALGFGAGRQPVEPALGHYLQHLLQCPAPADQGGHHSVLHGFGHHCASACRAVLRLFHRRVAPLPHETLQRERPHPVRWPWTLHRGVMRRLAGGRPEPLTPPHEPPDEVAGIWFAHYRPADERARECAAHYRSSYAWMFLFAALALATAAVGLGFPHNPLVEAIVVGLELLALALIMLLVAADGAFGWQRRAIEYRLLAELCRKQQVLALLAWTIPRATAWATSEDEAPREPDAPGGDHSNWVTWLFCAWLREAPLPTGSFDAERVAAARVAALRDLVDDQIKYHTDRRAQSHRAGRRLVRLGEAFFGLVILVVVAKLSLLALVGGTDAALLALGLAGAILPGLSAAFVGIRAYAELELLAEQSHLMLHAMRRARDHIAALDPAGPLASQALGRELAAVATLMLEDLQGWAQLFRAKVVEA